jgi:hypothetical protein
MAGMSGEAPSTRVQQIAAARPAAQTAEPVGPAPVEVGTAAGLAASEHGRLLAGVRAGADQVATLREIAHRYGNRHAARAAAGARALSRRAVGEEELKQPPWTRSAPGGGLKLIPGIEDLTEEETSVWLRNHETHLRFPWAIVGEASPDVSEDWMRYFDFGAAEKREEPGDAPGLCSFNGRDVQYDVAIDQFMREASLAGLTFDRSDVHTRTGNLLYALKHASESPYAKKPDKDSDGPVQVTIGIQANLTRHETLVTKEKSTDPVTYQVTGQVALQLHGTGKMGFELAVQGSVSFVFTRGAQTLASVTTDDVKATVTNVQMAGQAAWVIPFLNGALQMQTFVQAVAGINWVQEAGAASTTVHMKHYSMAQGVGGMQVVYTLPGTDKHLQLFIQAQKSITGTDPQSTQDLQGAIGLQWAF